MTATIFNLDTANLFVGDDNPDQSQYLVLNKIRLPALEESTKEHNPGGGVVGFSVGMRKIKPFMISFGLSGVNPDVLSQFMKTRRINYTIRGNMSNVVTQEDVPIVAVINGRMTKADISEFSKDNGVDTEYEINEIVRYRLVIGTDEKYFFDAFAGPSGIRIDGVVPFRDVARNLGLGV